MKTPRKLYLVVSRKAARDFDYTDDTFMDPKEAKDEAKSRNKDSVYDVTDWRVETFVKGD